MTYLKVTVVFVPSSNFQEGTRLIIFLERRDPKNAGNSASRLLGIRQCGDAPPPPTMPPTTHDTGGGEGEMWGREEDIGKMERERERVI